MTDFLIYTGLNLLIYPELELEEKKKGSPYHYGNIIEIAGLLSYEYLFKNKTFILPYPEYFYKVSFQVFFDSLLFKNNAPVLIDGLMVLTSVAGKNIIEAFDEKKKDL